MKTLQLKSLLALLAFISFWGCNDSPKKAESENSISKNQTAQEVDSLYDVAWDLSYQNPDSATLLAEKMSELSGDVNYQTGLAKTSNLLGWINYNQGKYDEALREYLRASDIYEKLGNKFDQGAVQLNIGALYWKQENYDKALSFYNSAKTDFEKVIKEDPSNHIAKRRLSTIYNNIGLILVEKKDYEKALRSFQNSLVLAEEIEDKGKIAETSNNLGNLFALRKNSDQAMPYYLYSLENNKENEDKNGLIYNFLNMGDVLMEKNDLKSSHGYYSQALQIAKELKNRDLIAISYGKLAAVYKKNGQLDSAYQYCLIYSELRDSLLGEESSKQVAEMNTKYETAKKEQQIALQDEKIGKQRIITVIIVLTALLIFLFIYRFYRIKHKANKLLELKNEQIANKNTALEQQKKEIEHINKEISDSINYARGIQEAMLPPADEVRAAIPQSFIMYKPKDVVSGDFYWFRKKDNSILIAAADCTGHGVPGAFMSMIGAEALNEAVEKSLNPSEMLSLANRTIKAALRQSGTEDGRRDGMDLALVRFNMEQKVLEYAGANRPIWIIRSGATEMEEIKATKKAIAGFTEDNQVFELHRINLDFGDTFYIFSDGFADQFGGEKGKKLMTSKFKEMLLAIQNMPMEKQGICLADYMAKEWMKTKDGTVYEQVDDQLIIGIRI